MEKNFYKFISEDSKVKDSKIKLVKHSDLDNWKSPEDMSHITGTKKLDRDLGYKVYEMLNEHGLTVFCSIGDYLKRNKLLIADESTFVEYRVRFAKIIPWNDFLDNNGIEEDEYDDLSVEEQTKLTDEYKGGKNTDDDGDMEFSVFLPLDVKSKGENEITYLALSDASNYLKVLNNSIPEVIRGSLNYNVFMEYPEETTTFINNKGIKISNKNLPKVADISNRLYRDSKFFGKIEYEFDKHFLNELISDWLKLL